MTAVDLRRVVAAYGRNALGDPVALRLALRDIAPGADPAAVDSLVAVAGSGAVDVLRAARQRGTPPEVALVEALEAAPAGTTATTVLAFADALDAADTQDLRPPEDTLVSHVPTPALPHRVRWDDHRGMDPAAPPARARRWRRLPVAAAGAVAVVAALVAVPLVSSGSREPAAPDRYAVEQVAQRYRALGAALLDGAIGCAPVDPEPGQSERVACSFGTWSMQLTTYDSVSRLVGVRERRTAPDLTAVREAVTRADGSAAVMRETADPADPTLARAAATLYWDAELPRPVSASVETSEVSMPELARFWDSRHVPGIARPDLPGPEITAAPLWKLARDFLRGSGATCGDVPAHKSFRGAVEEHRCSYPNGVTAEFVLLASTEQVHEYRTIYADPYLVRPGTQRLGSWTDTVTDRGQLIEYVIDSEGLAYLYFDEPNLHAFGLMYGFGPDQDRLKTFWSDVTAG
jgi:hypothetical protein